MPRNWPSVTAVHLWLIWTVVAVALLYAKPWGPFGWDELTVCAAPLLLLRSSMSRVNVLTIGLVVASLAWILAGEPSGGWLELACLASVLVVGIAAGDAARRAENYGTGQKSVVATLEEPADIFLFVLGRELSRARRHESSFAVLSADQHSAGSETSLDAIAELLDRELHAYADTVKVGDRVLALVPEVSTEGQHFLLRRLRSKAATELGVGIRIGLSHYPEDAKFAEDLIELADRSRCALASASVEHAGGEVEGTAASS